MRLLENWALITLGRTEERQMWISFKIFKNQTYKKYSLYIDENDDIKGKWIKHGKRLKYMFSEKLSNGRSFFRVGKQYSLDLDMADNVWTLCRKEGWLPTGK
jgi:hypothetical protein